MNTASWTIEGEAEEVHLSKERGDILLTLNRSPEPMTPKEVSDKLGAKYNNVKYLMWTMLGDEQLIKDDKGRYSPANPTNLTNPANLTNLANSANPATFMDVGLAGGAEATYPEEGDTYGENDHRVSEVSRVSEATRVVNVKDESYDVYIGRANSRLGLKQSDWHNPFKIGDDGSREEVIEKFERYLLEDSNLMARLPEIQGMALGCHCAPKPCHGDVLARLADLQGFLANPPKWFMEQARGILEDHTSLPDWPLNQLASAVADVIPNVLKDEQALPLVRAKLEEMRTCEVTEENIRGEV